MNVDMTKPPPGLGLAGADNTTFLGSNDADENAPKAARVSRAIALLKREFIAEALRVAAVKASHGADNLDIGDDLTAERDIRLAVEHLREAAKAFRELELTAEADQ